MKQNSWRILLNLGKITTAGAIIAAIAFAFATQDPTSPEVGPREAQADIADFSSVHLNDSQKFTKAIVQMGMQPRAFDYNGNTLFFASGSYAMKPAEFLEKSQRHFVKAGINKQDHSQTLPVRQHAMRIDWDGTAGQFEQEMAAWTKLVPTAQAMVDGDIVPTEVTADRVEMVGYDLDRDESAPLVEAIDPEDKSGKSVRNLMAGYRYMDAHWEPRNGRTAVTAVWSGDDFAGERMEGEGDQSPPDADVPACVGCVRAHRVQSLDADEHFQSHMFLTSLNVSETYEYYRSAMAVRGWVESGVQPRMNRLGELLPEVAALNEQGRLLSLERGEEAIQLAIMPSERGAQIVTLHQTDGAQNELPELMK